MTWTVMNTGFSSTEVMKDTIEKAIVDSANALQVIGKMTGAAKVDLGQVTLTATPVTITANGMLDVSAENIRLAYSILKEGNYTITQENIYVGALYDRTYNSVSSATAAAKESGLISINPLVDSEKPQETSAFMYWVIDLDGDRHLQNGEIANLVIVYADRDRPETAEHIELVMEEPQGVLLDIERDVPNISTSILDFGGTVKNAESSGD